MYRAGYLVLLKIVIIVITYFQIKVIRYLLLKFLVNFLMNEYNDADNIWMFAKRLAKVM